MTLTVHEVHQRMLWNCEALKRLLAEHEDDGLTPERLSHLHEILDEIGARTTAHAEALHGMLLRAHLDRRVNPFDRRQHQERRKP
mgnify:CR=1 FL=1